MSFTKKLVPTLETRKRNKDCIVAQLFVQNRRLYTSFATKDDYASFILSKDEGSDTCNEIAWLGSRVKTFLDIDCPLQLSELGFKDTSDFVKQFSAFLIENYKTLLGVTIKEHQLLWSSSTRPDKTSFHIIVSDPENSWKTEKINADLKQFVKILADKTMDIPGFHYLTEKKDEIQMFSILDTQLYNVNRCFRSLLCRKPINNVLLRPMKDGKYVQGSHSLITQHSFTETEPKNEYTLLVERIIKAKPRIRRSLLNRLAAKYGSRVHKISGSLIQLRNTDKCRYCPISQEQNFSDSAYFLRKNGNLYLGCHNAECSGRLKQIHTFQNIFQTYDCYTKILMMPKQERTRALVQEFLRSTCCFCDIPGKGTFVTSRFVPCQGFSASLKSREVLECSSLFSKNSDVKIELANDDVISISDVLLDLVQTRSLPIFSGTCWVPFLKYGKYLPVMSAEKFNTFSGFSLETETEQNIDFTKTKLFELFGYLTNNEPTSTMYLHDFIAAKLQKCFKKMPISLCAGINLTLMVSRALVTARAS